MDFIYAYFYDYLKRTDPEDTDYVAGLAEAFGNICDELDKL